MFVNLGGGLEVTHPFGHYWLQIKSVNFITNLGLIFELSKTTARVVFHGLTSFFEIGNLTRVTIW